MSLTTANLLGRTVKEVQFIVNKPRFTGVYDLYKTLGLRPRGFQIINSLKLGCFTI